MPTAALEELVRAEGDIDDRGTLTQCCALADGNPLIALELARSLTDDGARVASALLAAPEAAARAGAPVRGMRLDALDPVGVPGVRRRRSRRHRARRRRAGRARPAAASRPTPSTAPSGPG